MTIYERLLNSIASFVVSTDGAATLVIGSQIAFFIALYVLSKRSHHHEPFVARAFNATVIPIAVTSMLIVYTAINTSQIHESSGQKISQFYDKDDATVYDIHQIEYDTNRDIYIAHVKDKEIVLDKYENRVKDTFDETAQVLRITTCRAKESKQELLKIWHKPMTIYVGELIDREKEK